MIDTESEPGSWQRHIAMMAGSTQIGGDHYEAMPIQPWEATEAWWGRQALIYALLKDVVKYIARHERKNGLEDLKKAQDCLRKVVELKEAEGAEVGSDGQA